MNRNEELIELIYWARENGNDEEVMTLEHEMDIATGIDLTQKYNDMLAFETWAQHYKSASIERRCKIKEA
tara:strand:- start:416 stop:625 length:210 start_codon:yes stop_codon:yes gene_type:complete